MKNAGIITIVIYVAFFAIMIALITLPQRKQDKKKKQMLSQINVGDHIVTIGGIHAKIVTVRDNDFTVQIVDDKTKMRIEKWAVREVTKKNDIQEEKVIKAE